MPHYDLIILWGVDQHVFCTDNGILAESRDMFFFLFGIKGRIFRLGINLIWLEKNYIIRVHEMENLKRNVPGRPVKSLHMAWQYTSQYDLILYN